MLIKENEIILHHNFLKQWLHFTSPKEIFTTNKISEVENILTEVESIVEKEKVWAAGFLSYEASEAFDKAIKSKPGGNFPLIWFGIYNSPAVIEEIEKPLLITNELLLRKNITDEDYEKAFNKIKFYIEQGDTYQINFTYRLLEEYFIDPWEIFKHLVAQQGNHYSAFVNLKDYSVCSASPELFFYLDNNSIESHPMKGTIERGLTYPDDVAKSNELFNSQKDRAENLMIVDMVRNDLGRIAEISTVQVEKLFNIEKYPTLWQMTSKVKAVTRSSLSRIFRAMFPAASITGAPKINAMKIIDELETTPRKIYTGSIGFIAPSKQSQFNVAIRTLLFDKMNNKIEYGVGGGIVWDSILEKEIKECNTKANILKPLIPEFQLLETLLWQPDSSFHLLDLHLERMEKSALYFDFTFDRNLVLEELINFSGGLNNKSYKIRLLLSADGKIKIESSILTNTNTNEVQLIGLAKSFVSSDNVFLYHKTTNRNVYRNAFSESSGLNDVLLYNERDEITESTIANVGFEKDGKLFTPPVKCGLLAGTYRQQLLEQGIIEEKIIYRNQLNEFDNIYLINSVRGRYKVRIITGNHSH